MNIQRIRIKNFKSFYDATELCFNELHGLWRVSGQIGSGKTTIGEAIIYGLYGTVQSKNNGDLISWGEKHGLVELWCECRGNQLYIRRELNAYGQSPLSVTVNGDPMDISNKRSAQQQLEQEYLDVSRGTMELLCIISFNNFKSLSTLNAKDTKLFLDQVLGMEILTDYINRTKTVISELSTKKIQNNSRLSTLEGQYERMSINTPQPIEGEEEMFQNKLKEITEQLKIKTDEFNGLLQPLSTDLSELRNNQSTTLTLGKRKASEIKIIQQGICPTCHQPIPQDLLPSALAEREELLRKYNELKDSITLIEARIQEISSERDKVITDLKTSLKSQENELIRIREANRYQRATDAELKNIQDDIEKSRQELESVETEIDSFSLLNTILNGEVRQKILEHYILPINQKIREYAAQLSLPYIPEFDTQFKCTVKTGTLQQIPTSSLSTGQLKMVDMVIILGVLGSVLTKANCNVIFLDELFSNLDSRTRSELVEVLKSSLPPTTSCFIVSHQELDEDVFDGSIKLKLWTRDDRKCSELIIKKD